MTRPVTNSAGSGSRYDAKAGKRRRLPSFVPSAIGTRTSVPTRWLSYMTRSTGRVCILTCGFAGTASRWFWPIPAYAEGPVPDAVASRQAELTPGSGTLGQTFTADKPFVAVGGEFPTWNTTGSGHDAFALRGRAGRQTAGAATVRACGRQRQPFFFPPANPLPPGKYYLEMSQPVGRIGWWSYSRPDVYDNGRRLTDGDACASATAPCMCSMPVRRRLKRFRRTRSK